MSKRPKTPPHLTGRGRDLFEQITAEYALEAHHLEALTLACEQAMRAESAAIMVTKGGILLKDRFGQLKCNPAVEAERLAATACARLLRELGLDLPGAK